MIYRDSIAQAYSELIQICTNYPSECMEPTHAVDECFDGTWTLLKTSL